MLACIGLKLVAGVWPVKDILSAVCASLLLWFAMLGAQPVLLLVIGAVALSATLLWPTMSAFMRSNIVSIACLLAAAIDSSCALCCSWRRVNIIAVVSPSSSAAGNSGAARAASLKYEYNSVAYKYCLCSSHFSVK
jgi:hypothetical protein